MPATALQAILIALTTMDIQPRRRIISETPDDNACANLRHGGSISGRGPKGTLVTFQCDAGKGTRIEYELEPVEPEKLRNEKSDEPQQFSETKTSKSKHERQSKMRREQMRESHERTRKARDEHNLWQQKEQEEMRLRAQQAQETQEQELRQRRQQSQGESSDEL